MGLRTILVDDEGHCLELLAYSLGEYCPEVEIIGSFTSPLEARVAILQQRPELVFMDIQMPGMNGLELVNTFPKNEFQVVFCTAYDRFAIEALRASAADYLLKPLDEAELVRAVERVKSLLGSAAPKTEPLVSTSLSLPTFEGLEIIEFDQILYCKSESNYCNVYSTHGKPLLISKTLKEIESRLPQEQFFRVHNSFVVNLKQVRRFLKSDGGQLEMKNGDLIRISRSRKEELLARLQ